MAERRTPPRILQPESVPVVGTDAQRPALSPERLQAEWLRRRFAFPPAGWLAEHAGDGGLFTDRGPAAAAVLVPIVERPDGLQVLLTQRTAHLRDHAGQIAFPGGRAEPEDADAAATALRETEEEVGLDRRHVELLGTLPTYTTVTHFVVTPVVALVRPPFTLKPDPFEVAEVFELPLAFLMNPAHHRRHEWAWEGGTRQFWSMPHDGRFVWGATAAMLRNLYGFLAAP